MITPHTVAPLLFSEQNMYTSALPYRTKIILAFECVYLF